MRSFLVVTSSLGLLACGSVLEQPDAGSTVDGAVADGPSPIDACTPSSGSQQFSFTGAVQTLTVPTCVTSITVEAWGAQGGHDDTATAGGLGGYAGATVPVTPGERLEVYVGGAGTTVVNATVGGFNGGGGSVETADQGKCGFSGTGGGASDVRRGSDLAGRLVVAGGGGGGGYNGVSGAGGAGGGLDGASGSTFDAMFTPGGGGSQTAGGAVGWAQGSYANAAGEFGQGALAYHDCAGNGGGGGGWYGGGTGGFGGGGGGSGYVDAPGNTGTVMTVGVRAGDGEIIVSW